MGCAFTNSVGVGLNADTVGTYFINGSNILISFKLPNNVNKKRWEPPHPFKRYAPSKDYKAVFGCYGAKI